MPSRTVDTKEVLALGRAPNRRHPERRVLAVSDETKARFDDVVVVHRLHSDAPQLGDLAAMCRREPFAHLCDRTASPRRQRCP